MPSHPIFAEDMREIVESFVVETREVFERLDNDLLQLEQTPDDKALVDEIFRAVHTVKGTSGFLSLEQLNQLAHHFEEVLNLLRRGRLDFRPEMMDVMFEAFDLMKVLVSQVVAQELETIDLEPVIAALDAIAGKGKSAPEEGDSEEDELEAMFAQFAAENAPQPVAETNETKAEEPEVVEAHHPQAPEETAAPESGPPVRRANTTGETIRVDVDRLDNLLNLVGELVLGRNRLSQLVSELDVGGGQEEIHHELSETGAQIDFITTELQSAIMHTRMVQIGRVFNKFPRVVRDLAREFKKGIKLDIEGAETELDKSLIEEIGDPLVHLIRNAADHGIESPETRVASGKPEEGTVRLTAAHEGNHIVITIQDDGAGMDPAILKKKAVEKKLITEREAAEMSEQESLQLIFRPGFSTAQTVSKVSGRGVGMDVVKTNITRLNGTVAIDSVLGKGTTFTLKLPLTLAIIQSLLVRVFNKFPRVVRDLAREFKKGIKLDIEGAETELDKSLIEEIGDPLVHLIRNAADHGIESPETRVASGKPEEGTVRLTAAHEGNHIVITIQDDGAGMDPAILKKKAVEKKLITEREAAEMSEQESLQLIFRPGFSTAQTVSKVSGRGVGMDVVKTNITRLNGTVAIDSVLGKGTTFTLKLPLTLAIIQSLLVRVANETFAIPLHSVVEVVNLGKHAVSSIKGREVVRLREQVLPLIRIGKALKVPRDSEPDIKRQNAVVVAIAHHRVGFVVDDLIGQKEIVIKALGSYLKKVPGIAGSTILGDGRVIMILDIGELLRMHDDTPRNGLRNAA